MGSRSTSNWIRGALDLMALRSLADSAKHGLAIARWIRDGSDDMVTFEDAALYQSLHRLERQGMVESRWGRSETNRRARIYDLTARGRRRLDREVGEFRDLSRAMVRLLEAGGGR